MHIDATDPLFWAQRYSLREGLSLVTGDTPTERTIEHLSPSANCIVLAGNAAAENLIHWCHCQVGFGLSANPSRPKETYARLAASQPVAFADGVSSYAWNLSELWPHLVADLRQRHPTELSDEVCAKDFPTALKDHPGIAPLLAGATLANGMPFALVAAWWASAAEGQLDYWNSLPETYQGAARPAADCVQAYALAQPVAAGLLNQWVNSVRVEAEVSLLPFLNGQLYELDLLRGKSGDWADGFKEPEPDWTVPHIAKAGTPAGLTALLVALDTPAGWRAAARMGASPENILTTAAALRAVKSHHFDESEIVSALLEQLPPHAIPMQVLSGPGRPVLAAAQLKESLEASLASAAPAASQEQSTRRAVRAL